MDMKVMADFIREELKNMDLVKKETARIARNRQGKGRVRVKSYAFLNDICLIIDIECQQKDGEEIKKSCWIMLSDNRSLFDEQYIINQLVKAGYSTYLNAILRLNAYDEENFVSWEDYNRDIRESIQDTERQVMAAVEYMKKGYPA